MAVDIGAEAINRATNTGNLTTVINKTSPASFGGLISFIDIWALTNITGLMVGTFYVTNGNTLKCRDSETIAGTITAGAKVTKAVSLVVVTGDYIGSYFTGGTLERDTEGGAGWWHKIGEYIDPGDETEFISLDGDATSLGGYIVPSVPVTDGDLIGISVIKKS